MLSQDFKEFVSLLNKHDIEYLSVGGYAVGAHGHPRYTGDLDVWINPTLENAKKMVDVLDDFGFSSFNLTEADFVKAGNVIQMGYPPFRIDILTKIDGVEFADCYPNRTVIQYDEMTLNIIGMHELKENKKASGRLKDLDDLINLNSHFPDT